MDSRVPEKSPISSACPSSSTPSPFRSASLLLCLRARRVQEGSAFPFQSPKSSPPTTMPLHQRKTMRRKVIPGARRPGRGFPSASPLPDHVDFAIVGGGFRLSLRPWFAQVAPGRSVLVLESASLEKAPAGAPRHGAPRKPRPAISPASRCPRRLQENLARITNRLALNASGVWELSRSGPAKKVFADLLERFRRAKSRPPRARRHSGPRQSPRRSGRAPRKTPVPESRSTPKFARWTSRNPVRLRVRCNHRRRSTAKESARASPSCHPTPSPWNCPACAPRPSEAHLCAGHRPLSAAQLKALGLSSRRPFYTVTFLSLGTLARIERRHLRRRSCPSLRWRAFSLSPRRPLDQKARARFAPVRVRRGEPPLVSAGSKAASAICTPVPCHVRITTAGAAPILFTEKMLPIFAGLPRRGILAANT